MNGYPAVDPQAAARAERTMQAREQAKIWTNALKEQLLSAGLFFFEVPMIDASALFIGAVDHELRESGYEIASHSHAPIGKTQNGAFIVSFTFLVRARGEAPRVMIA